MAKANKEQKVVMADAPIPVVVTTEKKGVFYGYFVGDPTQHKTTLTLTNARMVVYWSASTKGVLGLAARGPQSGSRVTDKVPQITLHGVTSVMVCSEAAVGEFEKGVWS